MGNKSCPSLPKPCEPFHKTTQTCRATNVAPATSVLKETQMKICKKIATFLLCALVVLASLSTNATAKSNANCGVISNDIYLYAPKNLVASNDFIFSSDEVLGEIKAHSITNRTEVCHTQQTGVWGLFYEQNYVYSATVAQNSFKLTQYSVNQTFEQNKQIEIYDSFTTADANFKQIESMDLFQISNKLIALGLYSQTNNASIRKIFKTEIDLDTNSVSTATLTPNTGNLIGDVLHPNAYQDFAIIPLQQIVAQSESKILVLNSKYVFEINTADSNNVEVKFNVSDDSIELNKIVPSASGAYLALATKTISNEKQTLICTIKNNAMHINQEVNATDICANTQGKSQIDTFFVVSTPNCTISSGTLSADETSLSSEIVPIISNNFYQHPTGFPTSKNAKIMEIKEQTPIYDKPFSQTATMQVEPQTKVLVLKEEDATKFKNYTYCMFVTPALQNQYGYIQTSKLQQVSFTQSNKEIYAKKDAKLYKYPSLIEDSTNIVIKEFSEITKLFVQTEENTAIYAPGSNIVMLKVMLQNGEVGFISQSATEELLVERKELISTNCQITKQAIVYEDENGITPTAITLNKGDRVFVAGRLKYNKEYTQIKFNDANGNEITGYVQTSALKNDGLSTLQIVGLVLLSFNIIFLVIIIYVKKKIAKD